MKKIQWLILIFFVTSAHAFEFRILSWNTYMLPSPIKESLQKKRISLIPGKLKETRFDLLFMQEAFMKSFRTSVGKALKKTHPHTYYLKSPSFPFPVFGSGLYVVSKYPVKLLDRVYFKSCTDADCFAAKGAALIEITLPNGDKIQVSNTHLQATENAGAIRMKQLGQIHRMLLRHRDPDIPQFLIGDLNIDTNEPEFMLGLSLLGMDYTHLTGPILWTSGRKNSCYKTGSRHEWVDHMWFNNYPLLTNTNMRVRNFSFVQDGAVCPLSDHHAIEASFRF
jgi:endonuclease/exonuclease/phosphatase family metal-dependent hydrolase